MHHISGVSSPEAVTISIPTMSEAHPTPSKRTSWLEAIFWMVVAGLLFWAAASCAESFDRLTLRQFLFRLDFRYWHPNLAYPLWLIFTLLAINTVSSWLFRADHSESGRWGQRFKSIIFATTICLIILITYLFINLCTPLPKHWFWWYPANLILFAVFLMEWYLIYTTKSRIDLTCEAINVRKWFLVMSFTITGELVIYNVLYMTGLIRFLSYPLWNWFGYGGYSHMAAFTFLLICASFVITFFVFKEWLAAIRQTRKAEQKESTEKQQQSE